MTLHQFGAIYYIIINFFRSFPRNGTLTVDHDVIQFYKKFPRPF